MGNKLTRNSRMGNPSKHNSRMCNKRMVSRMRNSSTGNRKPISNLLSKDKPKRNRNKRNRNKQVMDSLNKCNSP